jgi:hypothetical protein
MIGSRAAASRTPNGAGHAGRAPARSLTRPPGRKPGSYQGQGADPATPKQTPHGPEMPRPNHLASSPDTGKAARRALFTGFAVPSAAYWEPNCSAPLRRTGWIRKCADGPCWQGLSGPADCAAQRQGNTPRRERTCADGRARWPDPRGCWWAWCPRFAGKWSPPEPGPGPDRRAWGAERLPDSRGSWRAAIRRRRPPRERAIPRANVGRPQATRTDAQPLFAQLKCSVSPVGPRLATPGR